MYNVVLKACLQLKNNSPREIIALTQQLPASAVWKVKKKKRTTQNFKSLEFVFYILSYL